MLIGSSASARTSVLEAGRVGVAACWLTTQRNLKKCMDRRTDPNDQVDNGERELAQRCLMEKPQVEIWNGLPWKQGRVGKSWSPERFRRGVVGQEKPSAGSRGCSCRKPLTGARGAVEPGTGGEHEGATITEP